MNIPNLSGMNPRDRAELQAFCLEVSRKLSALEQGRYQMLSGQQVINASDATVPSGLTTLRQVERISSRASGSLESLVAAAVNKLKQDNGLV